MQARNFLRGALGEYIVARTTQDIEEARDELESVLPWGFRGRRKWREARMKVEVARRLQSYFAELLYSSTPDEDV